MTRQANAQVTLKILVADDEPIVVRVAESVLRKAGYDITAAENADAALEFAAASRGSIALLIVNHSLNARPGRNLVNDILSMEPSMQVLRFSGHLETRLLLTTPVGLSRNFDDVLIARKCPEHFRFEMFYPGKANGYPPQPFAGTPARAVRTPTGAGRTNKQPDFDRCEGSTPKRRLPELSSTFPQNS